MPRIVCSKDEQTYRVTKNEIVVVTYAGDQPYQLWFADEWTCPTCKHRVLTGFGQGPIWRRGGDCLAFPEQVKQLESAGYPIRHEREWDFAKDGDPMAGLAEVSYGGS